MARFTGVRTCTNRLGRSAVHGPACPEREVSPCPAARGSRAGEYRAAAEDALALIDGPRQRPADRGAGPHRRAGRAPPLRDRGAAARSRRRRDRRVVARPATAGADVASRRWWPPRPTASGGWRLAVIRHGQLAAAGSAPRCATHARRGRTLRRRAGGPARRGAVGRSPGRGDGAHRALARPARCADRAGRAGLLLSGQRGRALVAVALPRHARATPEAAEQLSATRTSPLGSELLGEPRPTREQLFGRPGVDRLGGAGQTGLPRRNPLGVAG